MFNSTFTLEPYKGLSTRHHCPACNSKDRSFSLYIYTATGEHVHPSVGRCNHESICGYHYTPKQYFHENNIPYVITPPDRIRQIMPKLATSFIDAELLKSSLTVYQDNNFVTFLIALFGEEIAWQLIARYFIGTSKHWPGSTVFWQIDTNRKIRTGKIMLYDAISGHRIKEPFDHIHWVHKLINQTGYVLKQSLFGEHLLIDKTKPIALVESEKTAIIASQYFPQFIWLAVGGKDGLNQEKLQILKGRKVVLFPDLKYFEKWSSKAKDFNDRMKDTRFSVSDLLEKNATKQERCDGWDIADYLEGFDWKQFTTETEPPTPEPIILKAHPAQEVDIAQEAAINWFNGHLLPSMDKLDICDTLNF